MPAILLTEAELVSFMGLPHVSRSLYVALRARMDFATGIVGAPHLVSWQALREDLYEEHRPGVRARSLTRWALLRAAQWLVRAGLVEMRSNPAQHQLVFHLPKAATRSHVRNQTAPIPHVKPHASAHRGKPQEPARHPPPEAAPHRRSVLPPVARNAGGDIATSGRVAWPASYPQGYPEADRAAIVEVTRKNRLDAATVQRLLDELVHREGKAPVRTRPGLFVAMVKQLRSGTFYGQGAEAERQGGEPLSEEEAAWLNEGGRV